MSCTYIYIDVYVYNHIYLYINIYSKRYIYINILCHFAMSHYILWLNYTFFWDESAFASKAAFQQGYLYRFLTRSHMLPFSMSNLSFSKTDTYSFSLFPCGGWAALRWTCQSHDQSVRHAHQKGWFSACSQILNFCSSPAMRSVWHDGLAPWDLHLFLQYQEANAARWHLLLKGPWPGKELTRSCK